MEESVKIHTILQCFVDLNLETNEMYPYDVQILNVTLDAGYYMTEEAGTLNINVTLNQPSALGIEEATLVISNITTSNGDIDTNGFPMRLKWVEGEQQKNISIPITRDFIEELDETFLIGLTNLINLLPGQFVQANVVVEDRTDLRVVSIISANVNTLTSPRIDPNASIFDGSSRNTIKNAGNQTRNRPFDPTVNEEARVNQTITFTVIEGEEVNIAVGLDRPSEFGVEKVDIVLFSNLADGIEISNPLVSVNAQRLEWAIGDQFKTITVSAALTTALEGRRTMTLELRNPENTKFDSLEHHRVQIIVLDPPVDRRFTTINFGDIYKQRGSIISGTDSDHSETELELRRISDNQVTNGTTLYWLVELGTAYVDEYNNPMVSESANYGLWPNYYFGLNENGMPANVTMRVTNRGIGDVQYGNNTYSTGQHFYVTMARDATTITLPTNDGLRNAGDILLPDNITLTANTFCESKYEFSLSVALPQFQLTNGLGTSGPHGFQLSTTSSSINLYPIGDFVLPNYRTVSMANANALALYSTYSNMRTRFDGSMCTTSFQGNNKVHSVRIKGLILLSLNSLNTSLIAHELRSNDDFNPICSASAGNSGGMAWASVPFEIL